MAGSCRQLQSLLDSETATHFPSPSPSLVLCIDSTPRTEILHHLRERLAPGTRMLLTFASLETPFVTSAVISPFRKTTCATSQPGEGGEGTCVGRGLRGVEVEVVPATSACIPQWHEQLPLDIGVVGEVVVRSKSVCTGYVDDAMRTASSKIVDHPLPWHRTGRLGAFDQEGQLWLFGPKPHRPGPRIPTLDSRTSLRAHRPSPTVTASLSSIPQAFADLR
jgi:acyl-CoA synthetase (AMP-forming)/AMP-acid ligase II